MTLAIQLLVILAIVVLVAHLISIAVRAIIFGALLLFSSKQLSKRNE